MGKQAKKRRDPGKHLSILLFLVLGGVAGFAAAPLLRQIVPPGGGPGHVLPPIAGMLALAALALWLQIVLHEAGHLVFGLLTGYRFSSFRVGSLCLMKVDGRLRIRRMGLAGTAGQCLLAPPPDSARFPVLGYLMGGSLMNLLVGLGCLAGYLLIPHAPMLRFFLLMMALVGVLYAVSNGLPSRTNMVDNDGYNVLLLRNNPAAKRALWIALAMNARMAQGEALTDMPADWFDLPPQEEWGSSLVATLGVFRANWLMAKGALQEGEGRMAEGGLQEADQRIDKAAFSEGDQRIASRGSQEADPVVTNATFQDVNQLMPHSAFQEAGPVVTNSAFQEADRLMARLLSSPGVSLPGIYRHLLLSDRAYCALMGAGFPGMLTAYRAPAHQKAIQLLSSQLGILRTQYAYALLETRDPQAAAAALQQFDKQAKHHPYAADVDIERQLMLLAAGRAERGLQAAPSAQHEVSNQ